MQKNGKQNSEAYRKDYVKHSNVLLSSSFIELLSIIIKLVECKLELYYHADPIQVYKTKNRRLISQHIKLKCLNEKKTPIINKSKIRTQVKSQIMNEIYGFSLKTVITTFYTS